jgi:hypothetical protein
MKREHADDCIASAMHEGPCHYDEPMPCGHYPVNLSVLGHCRACDYEEERVRQADIGANLPTGYMDRLTS